MVYNKKTLEILHSVSDEDRKRFEEMIKQEKNQYNYLKKLTPIFNKIAPIIIEKIKPIIIDNIKKLWYNTIKSITSTKENNNV